jgi:para-nitrobenzyl esterase
MQPVRSLSLYPRPLGDQATDEDCLYLNVWAPAEAGPHPVMVWVYGGSNIIGATSQPQYDGASFARDGVVCVTIGYRVGAFGFTELGALLGPEFTGSGNNALRDLLLGLRWVRDNIAAFGGDPAQVTLAGESAGGKNVCSLLAAPAAAGLFRSAIVESGGGQTVHTVAAAQEVAARYVAAMGIAVADAASLLTRPAGALLDAENKMLAAYPRGFAYRGVVDGVMLPEIPLQAIRRGGAREVSLLIGTNRDESVLFQPPDAAHTPIGARELAQLDVAAMQAAEARYRAKFPDMSDIDRRIRLTTAEEYWIPCVRVAEAHAAAGGQTFMYRFDRAPRVGPYQGRAGHTSELPFVWDNFTDEAMRPAGMGAAEQGLATTMHAAWVQFIRTGTPAAPGLPLWTPYAAPQRATMVFDEAGQVQDDPAGNERSLWDGVL